MIPSKIHKKVTVFPHSFIQKWSRAAVSALGNGFKLSALIRPSSPNHAFQPRVVRMQKRRHEPATACCLNLYAAIQPFLTKIDWQNTIYAVIYHNRRPNRLYSEDIKRPDEPVLPWHLHLYRNIVPIWRTSVKRMRTFPGDYDELFFSSRHGQSAYWRVKTLRPRLSTRVYQKKPWVTWL